MFINFISFSLHSVKTISFPRLNTSLVLRSLDTSKFPILIKPAKLSSRQTSPHHHKQPPSLLKTRRHSRSHYHQGGVFQYSSCPINILRTVPSRYEQEGATGNCNPILPVNGIINTTRSNSCVCDTPHCDRLEMNNIIIPWLFIGSMPAAVMKFIDMKSSNSDVERETFKVSS